MTLQLGSPAVPTAILLGGFSDFYAEVNLYSAWSSTDGGDAVRCSVVDVLIGGAVTWTQLTSSAFLNGGGSAVTVYQSTIFAYGGSNGYGICVSNVLSSSDGGTCFFRSYIALTI